MSDIYNVRGVPPETQRRAKAAAAHAGITQGRWVTQAIEVCVADPQILAMATAETVARIEGVHHVRGSHDGPVCDLCDPTPVLQNGAETPIAAITTHEGRARLRTAAIGKRVTKKNARAVAAKGKPEKKQAKAPRTCAHGTRVGFNCWQCGGLAKEDE